MRSAGSSRLKLPPIVQCCGCNRRVLRACRSSVWTPSSRKLAAEAREGCADQTRQGKAPTEATGREYAASRGDTADDRHEDFSA